jgi:hypothetical protein
MYCFTAQRFKHIQFSYTKAMAAKRIIACVLLAAIASPIAAFAPASSAIRPATKLAAAGLGVNEGENRRAAIFDDKRLTAANAAALSSVLLAATLMLAPLPSHADGGTKDFKLPPIDYSDKVR